MRLLRAGAALHAAVQQPDWDRIIHNLYPAHGSRYSPASAAVPMSPHTREHARELVKGFHHRHGAPCVVKLKQEYFMGPVLSPCACPLKPSRFRVLDQAAHVL